MGSSFGRFFTVTTFGESHGAGVGVIVDGVPAGMDLDVKTIQKDLDKRRPGTSDLFLRERKQTRLRFYQG